MLGFFKNLPRRRYAFEAAHEDTKMNFPKKLLSSNRLPGLLDTTILLLTAHCANCSGDVHIPGRLRRRQRRVNPGRLRRRQRRVNPGRLRRRRRRVNADREETVATDRRFVAGIKIPLSIAATAVAMMALSACASFDTLFRQTESRLPIESFDLPAGQIASAQAFETSEALYVAGTMRKSSGSPIPIAAHIDIQLIGRDGQVLAEKQDDLGPAHPRVTGARSRRYPYAASFPLDVAKQAVKIRVSYHLSQHARAANT